ncbi:MAG: peptidyl-prolyl cis-trans isomerase [Planctomycetes bacterium]|nr:peptidyl-prolyl cis-trans isomerase [Planctomycetota bacterium]
MPIDDSPEATDPVSQMTIQTETVSAQDIWIGHDSDLAEKSKSMKPDEFRNLVSERGAQLIGDKIAEMLVYQKAALRIESSQDKKLDAMVDAEIRKTITSDFDGIQRKYEKELESQGRTLEQVRAQFRRQMIIAAYLEGELKPKVPEPTRAELLEAYDSNHGEWQKPARRKMSLIDVRVGEFLTDHSANPTPEQLAEAKEKAQKQIDAAKAELLSGANFADVAHKYSQDGRAADGGKWDWVNPTSIRDRFQPALKALDALAAGAISDVIETNEDFFLVRCDELEPGFDPDFESIQPRLRDQLFRRSYNDMIGKYIADLRKNARIQPTNLSRFHAAVVEAGINRATAVTR